MSGYIEVKPASEFHDWSVTHDFMFVPGGAEVTTKAIANDALSGADVWVVAGDPIIERQLGIRGSVRQLPLAFTPTLRTFRLATPLYPSMLRKIKPINGHVIASSYAFAHHVRCTGLKVVYCHSPLRQVWSGRESYAEGARLGERIATGSVRRWLQSTDLARAREADLYIATSTAVADRIRQYYGIDKVPIIPPPVARAELIDSDNKLYPRSGLLWVGRITEPYKKLSLVLQALRALPDTRLTIVGDGPDRQRLERIAPRNVNFVGWQSKAELSRLYAKAEALIFPSEDDFGIVPVEAMAHGTPVIAYRRGGAVDTVLPGTTGVFFDQQTPSDLLQAIRAFSVAQHSFDDATIRSHASQYDVRNFALRLRAEIRLLLDEAGTCSEA